MPLCVQFSSTVTSVTALSTAETREYTCVGFYNNSDTSNSPDVSAQWRLLEIPVRTHAWGQPSLFSNKFKIDTEDQSDLVMPGFTNHAFTNHQPRNGCSGTELWEGFYTMNVQWVGVL